MSSSYRLNGEVMRTERVARWRPLFKLGPCHPMYGWITVLFYRAAVVSVTGWFAIVLTGRLPLRPGDYLVAVLRYQRRVLAFLLGLAASTPGLRVVAGYVDPGDSPAVPGSARQAGGCWSPPRSGPSSGSRSGWSGTSPTCLPPWC